VRGARLSLFDVRMEKGGVVLCIDSKGGKREGGGLRSLFTDSVMPGLEVGRRNRHNSLEELEMGGGKPMLWTWA